MSLDPAAQRTSLLASVLHLGLLGEGDEPRAAALSRRISAASVTGPLDGPSAGTPLSVAQATSEEGLTPSGPTTGEVLVQSAHLEETTLVVAGAGTLYRFTTRHPHDDHVDDRAGAWAGAVLAAAFVGWYPFPAGSEHGAGILEIGDERFLVAQGEGEGAAAIAQAAQAARSL
jgi:hypothetical protein